MFSESLLVEKVTIGFVTILFIFAFSFLLIVQPKGNAMVYDVICWLPTGSQQFRSVQAGIFWNKTVFWDALDGSHIITYGSGVDCSFKELGMAEAKYR